MPIDPSTSDPDGTLEIRDGRRVLRYERHLVHSPQRVWAALTEPDQLVGWLAEAECDLVEGGAIRLRWSNTDDDGNHAVLHGTITRVKPPTLLEWDSETRGKLRWELREAGTGTALTLTVTVDAPDEDVALARAGWHIHLEHLADSLDGQPVEWSRWDRDRRPHWTELRDRYAARQ